MLIFGVDKRCENLWQSVLPGIISFPDWKEIALNSGNFKGSSRGAFSTTAREGWSPPPWQRLNHRLNSCLNSRQRSKRGKTDLSAINSQTLTNALRYKATLASLCLGKVTVAAVCYDYTRMNEETWPALMWGGGSQLRCFFLAAWIWKTWWQSCHKTIYFLVYFIATEVPINNGVETAKAKVVESNVLSEYFAD